MWLLRQILEKHENSNVTETYIKQHSSDILGKMFTNDKVSAAKMT
jgi:hypothetical protein